MFFLFTQESEHFSCSRNLEGMNVLIYMQLRVSHRKVEKGGKGIVFRMKRKLANLNIYISIVQAQNLFSLIYFPNFCITQ